MLRFPLRSARTSALGSTAVMLGALALAALPAWVLVGVSSGIDRTPHTTHEAAAFAAATVIALLGLATAIAAWRRRDARTLIGSFVLGTVTVLLLAEGTAFARQVPFDSGVLRLPGLLVVPVAGVILSLGRLRSVVRPGRELVVLRTGAITLTILGILLAAWATWPDAVDFRIPASSPVAIALFAFVTPLLAITGWSATRTAFLTRRPIDGLLCIGLTWLMPAHLALATSVPGDVRWTVGHLLQFAGFALLALHTSIDLSRRVASRSLMGGLRTTALVERSTEFLGARVTALVDRLTEKDPSTAGHVERVAILAVQMGEHLHLPTGRLRLLAAGGLLHDIGKLAVPSEVLNKPARLTDEEFEIVQRHPSDGRALLAELGGYHRLVLDLVELHHERIDGSGYPHGLAAEALPLEVRILAVADVFDALTTDRPYRHARSAFDALAEIDSQAGSGLDARCVGALRQVLGKDQLVEIRKRVNRDRPAPLGAASSTSTSAR